MSEGMTDYQLDKIIKMFSMILDGCKDLAEAKKKVAELMGESQKGTSSQEEK